MLCNVVVDTVVWHWILLVKEEEAVTELWGVVILSIALLFYAYYGLIASMRPEWLQGLFDYLTGILYQV